MEFGENFTATTGLRIAYYDSVRFGDNVLVGWNVQISDTDFHAIKDVKTGIKTKGHGSVSIGKDVWIANGCRIYKNVTIPEKCVVGAETVLFKGVDTQPCSLITNNREITVSSRRIYHDRDDDQITY